MKSELWEERFDEKWLKGYVLQIQTHDAIKSFIREEIAEAEKRAVMEYHSKIIEFHKNNDEPLNETLEGFDYYKYRRKALKELGIEG